MASRRAPPIPAIQSSIPAFARILNPLNVDKDTSADKVLISRDFYYFRKAAPSVPETILHELGYKNGIGHRKLDAGQSETFLSWLRLEHQGGHNLIAGDPFDFEQTGKRYSGNRSSQP